MSLGWRALQLMHRVVRQRPEGTRARGTEAPYRPARAPLRSGNSPSHFLYMLASKAIGPVRSIGQILRASALAPAACVFFAACSDPLSPRDIEHPELRSVTIDDARSRLVSAGVLTVIAFPADTSFRLRSHQRVPIELVTSAGDRESIRLFRLVCPARVRGPYFECFRYDVLMKAGHDAREVAEFVNQLNDRLLGISASGQLASITVFDPEDQIPHAERARSWPGVGTVQLPQGGSGPGGYASDPRGWLMAPIRVDFATVAPHDGVLQVHTGDTVQVWYAQPSGATLYSATRVVP